MKKSCWYIIIGVIVLLGLGISITTIVGKSIVHPFVIK